MSSASNYSSDDNAGKEGENGDSAQDVRPPKVRGMRGREREGGGREEGREREQGGKERERR